MFQTKPGSYSTESLKFCKQNEEGWIGFDANGDEYICRDVDHDNHPHWVKPSTQPSQSDAADVMQRYYAAINAGDYATACRANWSAVADRVLPCLCWPIGAC